MIGLVSVVGSVIKFAVKPALKLANKAPKGTLTGLGGIVAGAGVAAQALSGQIVTSENIVAIINASAGVITAIGGVIAAFGAQRDHQS